MDKLGRLIREKRTEKGETLKQLAKALECSEVFAKHIESARSVPISPRLITALRRHYRIPASVMECAANIRTRRAKAYLRQYRKAA